MKIISFWKKYFLQLFQYSERTIASTETSDTSTERSDTQLFGSGKSKGVAISGRLYTHLPQKDIEKKSKFNGAKSGLKKIVLIAQILFLYHELSVCPLILNYIKVYLVSSPIAKPTWMSNFGKPRGLLGFPITASL